MEYVGYAILVYLAYRVLKCSFDIHSILKDQKEYKDRFNSEKNHGVNLN